MIAFSGSIAGTGGTKVRPAPSRAPRSRVEPVPIERVARVPPARAVPIGALASRFEDVILLADDGLSPAPLSPVAVTGAAPAGVPQTSQYPSWMEPEHPGWVHRAPFGTLMPSLHCSSGRVSRF